MQANTGIGGEKGMQNGPSVKTPWQGYLDLALEGDLWPIAVGWESLVLRRSGIFIFGSARRGSREEIQPCESVESFRLLTECRSIAFRVLSKASQASDV
jgi:hypothetical protein